MSRITCENLKFVYKDKTGKDTSIVFLDFNASFNDKESSVILGPSGCGKTTLLNILAGLRSDYEGQIKLDDKPIESYTMREKDLAYLTQNIVLYPTMTVFENIAFPLSFFHLRQEETNARVREIAKLFGIEHTLTRKPKYLSYGQQHRVALAKALIKEPTLLLLDEPFTGLDPLIKEQLLDLTKQYILSHKVTVLYVTHDYFEALKMGEKIYLLEDGKITFEGTNSEIRESKNSYLLALKEASEIKKEDLND